MQTPAEKYLIKKIIETLAQHKSQDISKILNVGAGKSIVLEESIAKSGNKFICDRVDIVDCQRNHPNIGQCLINSVESMTEVKTESYLAVFANYVLEHVADLDKAAKEINRVLKPKGLVILSLPNSSAPEFILSKYTPTWFHQFVKGKGEGKKAFAAHYAYKSIKDLISIFKNNNFTVLEEKYYPFSYGYLYKFPIISYLSKIYDRLVDYFKIKFLMGNICLVMIKEN